MIAYRNETLGVRHVALVEHLSGIKYFKRQIKDAAYEFIEFSHASFLRTIASMCAATCSMLIEVVSTVIASSAFFSGANSL